MPSSGDLVREAMAMGRDGKDAKAARRRWRRSVFQREMAARELQAVNTTEPYTERLVQYWSNHFTVSTTQARCIGLAGAFEREAIRPNVTGRFEDMLLAVTRHPAMLVYLDNARSIGPDSRVGTRRGKGLNENLAREILELHTLGVNGGYGQEDVVAFANLLTGWSIDRDVSGDDAFLFRAQTHQPGSKQLLGGRYAQGEQGGIDALKALARHPSTARYVATRMASHFVADRPDPRSVAALEKTFLDTDGDLEAMARTLVGLRAVWDTPLSKLKTPRELVISAARALEFDGEGAVLLASERQLGQMPFNAPSPQGWSESAADWSGPQSVLDRVEWVEQVSAVADVPDALAFADATSGPLLGRNTRKMIARAAPERGTALFLASPEFQRR